MRQVRLDSDLPELLRQLPLASNGGLIRISDGEQDVVIRQATTGRWTRAMVAGQAAAERLALMYDDDVAVAVSRIVGSGLRVHVFPNELDELLFLVRLSGASVWHAPGCGTLDDCGLVEELQSRALGDSVTISMLDTPP